MKDPEVLKPARSPSPGVNPDRAHLLDSESDYEEGEGALSSDDEPLPNDTVGEKQVSHEEVWTRDGLGKLLGDMGYTGSLKGKIFNRYCNGGMDLQDAIVDAVRSKNGGKDPVEKKRKKKTGPTATPDGAFLLVAMSQTVDFNKMMLEGAWEKAEKHWKSHGKDSWASKSVQVTNVVARLKKYIKENPKGHMNDLLAWLKDRCPSTKGYLKMLTVLLGYIYIDFEYGTYLDRNADEEDQ